MFFFLDSYRNPNAPICFPFSVFIGVWLYFLFFYLLTGMVPRYHDFSSIFFVSVTKMCGPVGHVHHSDPK